MKKIILIISLLFLLCTQIFSVSALNANLNYECREDYCVQSKITTAESPGLSLGECNILCLDSAAIWPKPTGHVSIKNLTEINIDNISIQHNLPLNSAVSRLLQKATDNFRQQIDNLLPHRYFLDSQKADASCVNIKIEIADESVSRLSFETDEKYSLTAVSTNGAIIVTVRAQTYYGARHGMDTLNQLFVYDDIRSRIVFPSYIAVTDKPVFPWRGLLLDTSCNFVTPEAIKRTLDAMAASKLNIFHWHFSSASSFSYESKSRPELSKNGAYSPNKVYNNATVMDIIEYANVRGIKVVPEIAGPAHVGEGWQDTGVLTCFNWTPWQDYCAEPPCGQIDPSHPEVYDILEDIYGDMMEQFGADIFHMGGDEVNLNCWNNTKHLTNWMVKEKGWDLSPASFYSKVWSYFQNEAANRLYKRAGKKIRVILWSSDLTGFENVTDVLPPKDYIIQVWASAGDKSTQRLLAQNYSIILSNADALYLDCGFGAWVKDGNNWCSPYKGWQLIYENKPENIAGNRTNQVLGGEAAFWMEQGSSNTLDSRLWPRVAAFAETLWTAPKTNWTDAEQRMLIHRERLVNMGVDADALQPEWCLRNQQYCPLGGKFNK